MIYANLDLECVVIYMMPDWLEKRLWEAGKTGCARRTNSILRPTVNSAFRRFDAQKVDQAKRLKELEQESGKLKRLVAELKAGSGTGAGVSRVTLRVRKAAYRTKKW